MIYIHHGIEFDLKKEGILQCELKCINLKNIMLSDISQCCKVKHYMIPHYVSV